MLAAASSRTGEHHVRDELKLDFFHPVLDTVQANFVTTCNAECSTVLKWISYLMTMNGNFENAV
jgi:hypothetical protein